MLCRELVDYLADMPEWYLDELQQFGRVLHVHVDENFEYRWFGPNWRYLYPNR